MAGKSLQVPPNSDLTLGMVCIDKTTPGITRWRMTAHERFENPAGIMQGGFLAAFCDSAMGASVVTSVQGRSVSVANAEMKITLLASVSTGSILTVCAAVTSGSFRVAFAEASVTDDRGREVARATSTYILRERK